MHLRSLADSVYRSVTPPRRGAPVLRVVLRVGNKGGSCANLFVQMVGAHPPPPPPPHPFFSSRACRQRLSPRCERCRSRDGRRAPPARGLRWPHARRSCAPSATATACGSTWTVPGSGRRGRRSVCRTLRWAWTLPCGVAAMQPRECELERRRAPGDGPVRLGLPLLLQGRGRGGRGHALRHRRVHHGATRGRVAGHAGWPRGRKKKAKTTTPPPMSEGDMFDSF
jgi:hypothetical protein